jgi:hypothetical protein
MLNEYFSSVFTQEDFTNQPQAAQMFRGTGEEKLATVDITLEKVTHKLDKLKPDKSCGLDEVHPRVLKECKNELAPALKILFEKSLQDSEVPDIWKLGWIIPLHKGGRKGSPANYRPVSLTSVICKVLESILKDAIVDHLNHHQLILGSQHGFTKGRSCLTNLLTFLEDVTKAVDGGVPVDAIYLDFAKAFDKVPHSRLARKLKSHGISGKLYAWINEWLNLRKQMVTLNGARSDIASVISGVPQGSVLGPILFIIFINDIDLNLSCNIIKFADDTKIYMQLKDEESHLQLQEDLQKLCTWSTEWQMLFNNSKCSVIHFGYNNNRAEYRMGDDILEHKEEEKDLGIVVHQSLKPSQQCVKAAKKANKILGMISRNISFKSPFIITKLYKHLVRPQLEYAIQAWRPWLKKDVNLLEGVQRRATKMVNGMRQLPYEERLRNLGLLPLNKRFERGDAIETFKIVKGIEDIDMGSFFSTRPNEHGTRGHAMMLAKEQCRLDIRKNFFSQRSVNTFNACPPSAVACDTVLAFKKAIAKKYNPRD